MNPLTLVKRIQNINSKEADLGISEEASWHAKYRDSAYVFVGGIPYDLTEGDLLAVFAQYGEVVDINLVRDKGTGKSKGFAFLAYEDQRSTILAVDNLNGAQILGRIIRVDHCNKYVKREEEDEETQQKKREARGVCRAFQRGECTRGASCKFSHDEKRAANTGWGHQEDRGSRWDHDKFEGAKRGEKQYGDQENVRSGNKDRNYRAKEKRLGRHDEDDETALKSEGNHDGRQEKRVTRYDDHERRQNSRDDSDRREERSVSRYNEQECEPRSRDDRDRREEKRSRRYDDEFDRKPRDDVLRREEKRSRHDEAEYDYRRDEKKPRKHGSDEHEPTRRRDRDNRNEKGSRMESKTTRRRDQDEGAGSKCSTHGRHRDDHRHERD